MLAIASFGRPALRRVWIDSQVVQIHIGPDWRWYSSGITPILIAEVYPSPVQSFLKIELRDADRGLIQMALARARATAS